MAAVKSLHNEIIEVYTSCRTEVCIANSKYPQEFSHIVRPNTFKITTNWSLSFNNKLDIKIKIKKNFVHCRNTTIPKEIFKNEIVKHAVSLALVTAEDK